MNKLSNDEMISRIFRAIAGDEELGTKGIEDRLVKVESFMEKLSWLVWLGGAIPKTILLILAIMNIYLAASKIFGGQ